MPRAGWTKPDTDHRLSDYLAFAMISRVFPPDVVDSVIADLGRVQRRNRMLPSRLVVYYVLGLALFSNLSYDEVIRLLVAGQSWSSGWSQSWPVPTKAALYKARLRLGHEPLRALYERVARPVGQLGGAGSFGSWSVHSIDSIQVDVPATPANEEEFGRPLPREGVDAALPVVQVLGLTELGTGAVISAAIGRCLDRPAHLATGLIDNLGPGQLVLAGAELYSPEIWARAARTGADLLWELPADVVIRPGARHSDGTYASEIGLPEEAAASVRGRHVRVMEVPHAAPHAKHRRFLTTIHDPDLAPAPELARLLPTRRDLALAFDEFRPHSNSPRIVLRSKMPDGVRQELYGFLCVHYAIRRLMDGPPAGNETSGLSIIP